MTPSKVKPDPAASGPANLHEADIGSGERTPAQQETDQMIKEIPPRGHANRQDAGDAGSQQKQEPSKG
ncbi:hypothetical protein [Massilia sp. TN1-12]|uniref:hypothetical protein n=1 Tax=Massilia paldalensis TaxID=3377675 RepID=UPI00384ECBC8